MSSIRLLWADDDSVGVLEPLGRMLTRKGGFALIPATSYQQAEEQLTRMSQGGAHDQIDALMLDTILPNSSGGVLDYLSLGIKLARKAADLGVRSIAFLTVVRREEVLGEYMELRSSFPHVTWDYFDKLTLLEPHAIDDLIASLKKAEK